MTMRALCGARGWLPMVDEVQICRRPLSCKRL